LFSEKPKLAEFIRQRQMLIILEQKPCMIKWLLLKLHKPHLIPSFRGMKHKRRKRSSKLNGEFGSSHSFCSKKLAKHINA
jgi:hypothetical protein